MLAIGHPRQTRQPYKPPDPHFSPEPRIFPICSALPKQQADGLVRNNLWPMGRVSLRFGETDYVAITKNSEVKVDRRSSKERRKGTDRRSKSEPVAVERRKSTRRKVQRRRQIDPTTCERDYSNEEIEFMQALDAYKRANGRMFPTCSEILEVIRDMGYVRVAKDAAAATGDHTSIAEMETASAS
jgi:hypothetical protein